MPRPSLATAYHEAGHCVVAWCLGLRPRRVEIVGNRGIAAHGRAGAAAERRTGIEAEIRICLAGPIAQRLAKPHSWRHRHGAEDLWQASKLAARLHADPGEADALIHRLEQETRAMLREERVWSMVTALAARLVADGTLEGKALRRFFAENGLPANPG